MPRSAKQRHHKRGHAALFGVHVQGGAMSTGPPSKRSEGVSEGNYIVKAKNLTEAKKLAKRRHQEYALADLEYKVYKEKEYE